MSDPMTVLLIEDNPGDARLIRELLAGAAGVSFKLEWASRLSAGLERLAQGGIDAILLDLSLPDSHGLETAGRVQAQAPEAPIVVLTGLDDEATGIDAVHQGAQDYLVKGRVDGDLLAHSIRYAVERKRLGEALQRRSVELQARNEELAAFAHTVAHDLKSLVSNVVGFAEVLEEMLAAMPEKELQEHLRTIAWSGRKMANVIDELLLLASVREAEVEIGPLDMASIVAESLQRLAHMIAEYQAEIVAPDASAWPVALGYGAWVEEVWVNYLSNAIKYGGQPPRVELGADLVPGPHPLAGYLHPSPPPLAARQRGEGALRGRFFGLPDLSGESALQFHPEQVRESDIIEKPTPERESRGMARFWVRDNGPGIPPERQAQLFAPFARLGQVSIKGHGLGLSIVRRIVEKLGGQVCVVSEGAPGQGSVFSFTLPRP